MAMPFTDADVANLAAEFEQRLRWVLTADEYATVITLNRAEPNPHICHSHDFTDAYEVMAFAFGAAFDGLVVDLTDDTIGAVIDAAWHAWKRANGAGRGGA